MIKTQETKNKYATVKIKHLISGHDYKSCDAPTELESGISGSNLT